jgi:hypothetical protein
MTDENKPKKKRGRKPGTTTKKNTGDSSMKVLQKEYDKLMVEKKLIDKKINVYEKLSKELGFKLSKRIAKAKGERKGKTKGKRGRKKKEVAAPEVKSE